MTTPRAKRILVIGYGNPGRCDDGLGPELAARVEALNLPDLTVETAFQLSIEHADLAARHDIVVFADAATDVEDGAAYYLKRLEPTVRKTHFAHSVPPETVLQLAEQCFEARPRGWALGIRPADIESFAEGLTPVGAANLDAAAAALVEAIRSGRLG